VVLLFGVRADLRVAGMHHRRPRHERTVLDASASLILPVDPVAEARCETVFMPMAVPTSYWDRLLDEVTAVEADYIQIIEASEIQYVNPNRDGDGVFFVGAADWGWGPSDDALTSARMQLVAKVRAWVPRFRLLFPHPTPELSGQLKEDLGLLDRWLERSGRWDHSIPADTAMAVLVLKRTIERIGAMRGLLPTDKWTCRLTIDTNALIDNPDLTIYAPALGTRYMVHILPVVLRELDDLKRSGRTQGLRDAAWRADKRLKGIRTNGDVLVGARVQGDIYVVFEHIEPHADGLPDWLDLDTPDDRFVASTLLLQSSHPGSVVAVATSDLNMQNKLAAIGLPFVEPAL
jgi:rRNA-processing protein FCF1